MRVNVDSSALRDPRVKMLAHGLAITQPEALGRLLHVWMLCYERRSSVVRAIEVDLTADREGFAEAMIEAGLAEPDDQGVYVRGVTERIEFLELQSAKGKRSGEKRREQVANRNAYVNQRRTEVQQRFGFGSTDQRTDAEPNTRTGSTDPRTYSPAPDLTQAPDQAPDHPRDRGRDEPGSAESTGSRRGQNPAATGHGDPEKVSSPQRAALEPVEPAKLRGPTPPDQAFTLAHLLLAQICTNHPAGRLAKSPERTRDATAERWAYSLDKLHRLDGMTWGEIEGMIVWAQRHSFWRGVILGADNLRDKWDAMNAQRTRDSNGKTSTPRRGPTAQALDDVTRLEAEEAAADAAKEQRNETE